MKYGPWHAHDVKPVHVGWYEVQAHSDHERTQMIYWNGNDWMCGEPGTLPGGFKSVFGRFHGPKWRGLKEKS